MTIYLGDLAWFVTLQGLLALAGAMASRFFIPQEDQLKRGIAGGLLCWTWVTLGMQLLGIAGLIARGPMILWTLLGLGLASMLARTRANEADSQNPSNSVSGLPGSGQSGERLFISFLLVWVALILGPRSFLNAVKVVSDGPIYHMYFATRWWQEGRIFWIPTPFGESAATYFPANGDLWFTWLVASWGGDRFARIGQVPFLISSCTVVYALGRQLRCSKVGAYLAAAWVATLYPLALFSFEPNVDTIFIAGYLTSVYFITGYIRGESGWKSLVLGGLSAGLAFGTKPTAIVFVPPWLLIASVLILKKRESGHRFWKLLGFWGAFLLPSGFWMLRNGLATANPWYPLHLELFGRVLLKGWFTTDSMKHSPYYIPMSEWRAFVDIMIAVLDPRLTPIWLAVVCSLGFLWKYRSSETESPRSAALWIGMLGCLNLAIYWVIIPYRSQQRFMLHGLALLAIPLARLFDQKPWFRRIGIGFLAVHILTPYNWPFYPADIQPPWSFEKMIPTISVALVQIPLNWNEWSLLIQNPGNLESRMDRNFTLLRLALGLIAFTIALTSVYPYRSRVKALLATISVSGTAIAGACWLTLQVMGTALVAYPGFHYYQAWTFLESIAPPSGVNIAYAGTNLPYYLQGRDLRNHVTYVNIDENPDWLLHQYHTTAELRGDPVLWDTPRPGWDRIHANYPPWLETLKRRKVRYLFVARSNPDEGPFNCVDAELFPIERTWADQHPDHFTLIYGGNIPDPRTQARTDGQVRIYRISL